MSYIKSFIDFLSTPTISFTLLTFAFPFIFPPNDWFDKKNRQWGIYKVWSNKGGFWIFISITLFFKIGVEQIPYPEGALIFHIEGITKALILFFVSSIPMIIRTKEITPLINKRQHKRPKLESNKKNNNWEEATIEDLNSGQFEAI